MKAKLTAQTIKKLEPKSKAYEVRDTEIKGFLLRVEPSGRMTYYISYNNAAGQRNRFRIGGTGNLSAAQARDIAIKRAADVAHGEDLQARKKAAKAEAERAKTQTLRSFVDHRYKPRVLAERKTGAATLARLEHNFEKLMDRPMASIDGDTLAQWRTEQLQAGKSKAAVNRDLVALRAVLAKAVDCNVLDTHPAVGFKPLKVDKHPKVRYLTPDEAKRLRAALVARDDKIKAERASANKWRSVRGYELLPDFAARAYTDHLTPMVLLSLVTGLRRGELFSLTWNDIDLDTANVTVEANDAKSGQTRHVPLNREAVEVLNAWRAQTTGTEPVFPNANGGKLDNVRKSWAGILKAAGISNFRWHDLRHDFASQLVMKHVALNTVRALLGHEDLSTIRYAHLAPGHKAEAVAMLDTP